MEPITEIYEKLTSKKELRIEISEDYLNKFASELGWNPSYFEKATLEDFANAHLIVEHGLENTAVLSFLNVEYYLLTSDQLKRLLNISYNNLVDWHIIIDRNKIFYIFNRYSPGSSIVSTQIIDQRLDQLKSEAFDKVRGARPTPNLPPLDDAIIETVSFWKRNLSALLSYDVNNIEISSLFNTLFFIRALEDTKKRYEGIKEKSALMLDEFDLLYTKADVNYTLTEFFKHVLRKLGHEVVPEFLIDFKNLKKFDSLHKRDLKFLLRDFYVNKIADFYTYDFSIMSKHAFSRIYERYVSILQVEETPQFNLFPVLPEEINKASGTVYTPQYISRFFAKYIHKSLSYTQFRDLKVVEPAVGSGIFLRTLLELQWETNYDHFDVENYKKAFYNVLGVDIDENACQATKLSLSMLYLLASNEFPKHLHIVNKDSIDYFMGGTHNDEFDVLISNPPFIRYEDIPAKTLQNIREYLGPLVKGKIDIYYAFIKIALDVLKPGGLAAFVLPHSFLVVDGAKEIRKYLAKNAIIKFWADLSAISVFGNTGVYITLIIFQKKSINIIADSEKATVLKCTRNVGRALEDVLHSNFVNHKSYSIYEVDQEIFKRDQWFVLSPSEYRVQKRLESFPPIADFLEIKQGFVSGADPVFIVNKDTIPENEESLYIPYLPDREMNTYVVPSKFDRYFFYPYKGEERLDEQTLENDYPATWQYLNKFRTQLAKRKSAVKDTWWLPTRLRKPKDLLQPKIISPHLTIMPRFSLDLEGKIGISRSPYLTLKQSTKEISLANDINLLYFFLGVLNSTPCFWHIANHSHKYSSSYNMLESKTLKNTPVPDPALVDPQLTMRLINLVKERMVTEDNLKTFSIEREIDRLVCQLYNLSEMDMKELFGY